MTLIPKPIILPPVPTAWRNILTVGGWAAATLLLSQFHEPWRDEAQAWLVAKGAVGVGDLFLRASAEATGPVYYLLLWPWAQLFPNAFPGGIFWISWVGTLALVWRLSEWELDWPTWLLLLTGYLLFYEYAAVARLYGWGGFFLLSGIRADKLGRRGDGWLGLACLTQLTFLIAVLCWRWSRTQKGLSLGRQWGVGVAVLLALLHLQWGSGLRPWSPPGFEGLGFVSLGSTLGTLIVPFPAAWGVLGYVLFALGVWVMPFRKRLPFLGGTLAYAVLFSFGYAGSAQARHGGALYWLWLGWVLWGRHPRWVAFLLLLSTGGGVVAWSWDLAHPYSHGVAAAKVIQENGGGDRPLRLSVDQDMLGFVTAASLNAKSLREANRSVQCPFFGERCTRRAAPASHSIDCRFHWFHVAHDPGPPPPTAEEGRWERIWGPGGRVLTDERLQVYELQCPL